ncbi:hypothetical protein [Parabacteroides goldsteinii]|uniref:hypothetical protein n=1 Tax=Parabacteroides goldsteinii TaxID=328812 RepID=UPI0039910FAE
MVNWNEYPLNLLSKVQVEKAVSTSSYVIFDINARELLSHNRFDIYAKLLYIDHKIKGVDMSYAMSVYKKHIEVITGYSFAEHGQPLKNSFDKFVECFDHLIEVFQSKGFDPTLSLIPVDADNLPMDGSHRVSCAAYFNKIVRVIKFVDYKSFLYTSKWFEENHLFENVLRAISLEACNWHSNLYMACLWPRAYAQKEKRQQALLMLEKSACIVSHFHVNLGENGLRNLLIQVYGFMSWIGNVQNHFLGIYHKLNEICFSSNDPIVEFILFQGRDLEYVLDLKEKIRNIFGQGKGSIHITDNMEETKQIARLIYNPNSLDHIKYAYPDKFLQSWNVCIKYKELLIKNGFNLQNYIIDSSMVMAINGIREAETLNYFTIDSKEKQDTLHSILPSYMECNDKYAIYHDIPIKDMIYVPQNYFVFNDLKFLTLDAVMRFKKKKGKKKDLLDVNLIRSFCSRNDQWRYRLLFLQNAYRRKKAHLILSGMNSLRTVLIQLHLLGFVKNVVRKVLQ